MKKSIYEIPEVEVTVLRLENGCLSGEGFSTHTNTYSDNGPDDEDNTYNSGTINW